MQTTDKMHPFEKAGLGKAPFKFIGYSYEVGPITLADGVTQVGAPGQPMSSCDYCCNGIANVYRIKSADGKIFKVGCDCVDKLYGDTNKTSSMLARDKVYQDIQEAKRQLANRARHLREQKRIEEGSAFVDAHKDLLESIPSIVREGESVWDRYAWFMVHAGNAGKLRIIKEMKSVIEKHNGSAIV